MNIVAALDARDSPERRAAHDREPALQPADRRRSDADVLVTELDACSGSSTPSAHERAVGDCLLAGRLPRGVRARQALDRRAGSGGRNFRPRQLRRRRDVRFGGRGSNEGIRDHALRLLAGPVARNTLALAFWRAPRRRRKCSWRARASTRRMLEDIASASSSIHVNQFGFRPGVVGDAFADALLAKAAEGVPVRLVVDRKAPTRSAARGSSTSGSPLPESRSASSGRRKRARPPARSAAWALLAGTWPSSAMSTIAS